MRTPPTGYASTAVWAAFEKKAEEEGLRDYDTSPTQRFPDTADWETFWPFFRDGYSAGVMEEDK